MLNYKINSSKNLKDYNLFILLFVLSIVLILDCNSKNKKSGIESSTMIMKDQEVYQITLWQGGGFTGLTTGFTLSSSGEVAHWQRFPGQSNIVLWIVKGYLSEVQKLKNQLEESGMLEIKYAENGNMTTGIKYETNDQQYIWTWNYSGTENDTPELLREWYRKAMDFCKSVQQIK